MTQNYVVGFLFDEQFLSVTLIRKLRPDWQRGKLNGIGGKMERGETPVQAMVREFKEETSVEIPAEDWWQFAELCDDSGDWNVFFFMAQRPDLYKIGLRNMTDEQIEVVGVFNVRHCRTIPNLQWLIPMAMQRINERQFWPYMITQGME